MPERGDMMRLHFPTKDESEHYIICSDNGDFDKLFSCLNASKGGKEPQKVSGPPLSNSNAPYEKYLTTPKGKGMLLNDGVVKYHTTGDISTIQMEDGKGIVISSEGNIEMLANNIVTSSTKQIHMTAGKKIEMISGGSSVIIDGEGNCIDKKAGDIYLESPLNKEIKILTEDEASKILSEAGYRRKKTVIGYTPDGIPITPENKFDDAIYNYLYAYWKEHSREYDPKKDVIPESEMNKMHPKTKNEFQFEKWLFEQYGMTSKEKTENTLMGNLNVLLEVSDVIDIAALPVGAIAVGAKLVGKKVIKEVGEKAVKEVVEETVEKTVKTEVSEEVAENAAKKELADTAEDLSQKTVKKEDALEDSSAINRKSKTFGGSIGSKIKTIQSKTPEQLLADGWEDVTNPQMAFKTTSREFYDPKSGIKLRFDKGVEGANGFEAVDHYHIYNPNYTNKKLDFYFDINGNPVGKGSKASHIIIQGGN